MSKKKETPAIWDGLSIGVVLLALLVLFAVGLTRWHKNDLGAGISLPDTLSGGFASADSPQAWDGMVSAGKVQQAQVSQIVGQASDFSTANATDVTKALGVAAAGRYYINSTGALLTVTAARGSGQAWFPGTGGTFSTQGDVTCYSQTDTSSGAPSSTFNCRRSSNDLTVEVTGAGDGLDVAGVASKTDEVFDHITKRHW